MKKQWFEWTVKFKVHRTWVEDGFDLTDDRALDMLSHDLRYAHVGMELRAKVVARPDADSIAQAQGYTSAKDARLTRESIANLSAAVRETEAKHPLPRCTHGNALKDHAGEQLEPSCGCRA